MQKVKFFKSIESELNSLELEINGWLAESGVKLISVQGNIAPQTPRSHETGAGMFSASDVLVIVVYEEANG